MRKLETLGLNVDETNIGSLSVYGSPAWYTILSQQCKETLESAQRSAKHIIFPIFLATPGVEFLQ